MKRIPIRALRLVAAALRAREDGEVCQCRQLARHALRVLRHARRPRPKWEQTLLRLG
jgi:hypothetical protein